MLHFSCDMCGHSLGTERYVARVEIAPAFDPEEVDEADLDADHLAEIAETIQQMEHTGEMELEDIGPRRLRFDLCAGCRERYLRDPLGREALRRLNFSKN